MKKTHIIFGSVGFLFYICIMINPYLIHTITEQGKVYYAGFPVDKVVKTGTKISYYSRGFLLGTTGIFEK